MMPALDTRIFHIHYLSLIFSTTTTNFSSLTIVSAKRHSMEKNRQKLHIDKCHHVDAGRRGDVTASISRSWLSAAAAAQELASASYVDVHNGLATRRLKKHFVASQKLVLYRKTHKYTCSTMVEIFRCSGFLFRLI